MATCTEVIEYRPRELVKLSEARLALEQASTLDDIKKVHVQAEAVRMYFSKAKDALEMQNMAAEIKLRAERKGGDLLAGMEKATGARGIGAGVRFHDGTTLADLGIGKTQSHRWQLMASLPGELFDEHLINIRDSGKELTSSSVIKLAKQQRSSDEQIQDVIANGGDLVSSLDELVAQGRKFRTIYADPPWKYGNQATRASTDNHYGTMSVADICAEPVSQLVEDDAHLHLWTTNAFLFEARQVLEAWGFEYKSVFVWVKPQMGIGNYWRVSHEFMLFGLRGKSKFLDRGQMSWAELPRTTHSQKPYEIRQKVELVSPGPYLEMYGRQALPDSPWTVYGNQIEKRLFA